MKRREFLEFMGRGTAGLAIVSQIPSWLTGCSTFPKAPTLKGLSPQTSDTLALAEGFESKVFLRFGDVINLRGETFGADNDYIGFIPTSPGEGFLWVNHESAQPFMVHKTHLLDRSKEAISKEQKAVGGSLVYIKLENGDWSLDRAHTLNRRWDATTPIPFAWHEPVFGAQKAIGTLSNCSGGVTPWGTFLTCEENYENYYGEAVIKNGRRLLRRSNTDLNWTSHFDFPPEHYGWVVEINPRTGEAQKLVGLGRFSHEGATVITARDGRAVVYSGDDRADECLYKFISNQPDSLTSGTLYVANLDKGRWLPLDINLNPVLAKRFKSQTELLVRTREAAHLVGGTPLDRPEDIEQDPTTGAMICALTNNKAKGNYFGSLLRLNEKDKNPLSLEFTSSTFLAGGPESGVACPDNMTFDKKGNLWLTTDISDKDMGHGRYKAFGNNSLFYVPMSGDQAGKPVRIASAPVDSELTGPCFLPDGTLMLSVQHPGEGSKGPDHLTSRWPDGDFPKASVVAISGPGMRALLT